MPCMVCDEEKTVRSHIIPRALIHAMKRPGRGLVMNRRSDTGWVECQSGAVDTRLLCERHEARLGVFDAYAVRLCKTIKREIDAGQLVIEVSNPEPTRLVAFAASVVWRYAASRSDLTPQRALGPYAERIEQLLFHDEPFDPPLLVSLNAYRLNGPEIMNMGAYPHLYSELDRRFWRFIVCGVIFDLMLDNRGPPPPMATLTVNGRSTFTLFDDFPAKVMREPKLATALTAMTLPRRPYRRRPSPTGR